MRSYVLPCVLMASMLASLGQRVSKQYGGNQREMASNPRLPEFSPYGDINWPLHENPRGFDNQNLGTVGNFPPQRRFSLDAGSLVPLPLRARARSQYTNSLPQNSRATNEYRLQQFNQANQSGQLYLPQENNESELHRNIARQEILQRRRPLFQQDQPQFRDRFYLDSDLLLQYDPREREAQLQRKQQISRLSQHINQLYLLYLDETNSALNGQFQKFADASQLAAQGLDERQTNFSSEVSSQPQETAFHLSTDNASFSGNLSQGNVIGGEYTQGVAATPSLDTYSQQSIPTSSSVVDLLKSLGVGEKPAEVAATESPSQNSGDLQVLSPPNVPGSGVDTTQSRVGVMDPGVGLTNSGMSGMQAQTLGALLFGFDPYGSMRDVSVMRGASGNGGKSGMGRANMGGMGGMERASMGGMGGMERANFGGMGGMERASMGGMGGMERANMGGMGGMERANMGGMGGMERANMGGMGGMERANMGGMGGMERASMGGMGGMERASMGGASAIGGMGGITGMGGMHGMGGLSGMGEMYEAGGTSRMAQMPGMAGMPFMGGMRPSESSRSRFTKRVVY